MKVKIEKDIRTLGDLFDPLSIDEKREILKEMGAQFEPVPQLPLGNLRPDNIHADYYIEYFRAVRKTPNGGFIATMIGGCDPKWTIDENLVVKAMSVEESLRRYADMIKEEYADMTDEQLAKYHCLGHKRFDRARDEMLRRGIISKVGESSKYEESEDE